MSLPGRKRPGMGNESGVEMTTTQARQDTLGEATLGELAEGLRGELIRPSDPSYDDARSIWNAAHDKKPALIVRCKGWPTSSGPWSSPGARG